MSPPVALAALETAEFVAQNSLAPQAEHVDSHGDLPHASLKAIAEAALLNLLAPTALGGGGCTVSTCVRVAERFGAACASTGLIWSMHQAQIAVVASHGNDATLEKLQETLAQSRLVASGATETGTGSLRESRAHIDQDGWLRKSLGAASYGRYAGAWLVSARRTPDSVPSDQIAAFAPSSGSCTLINEWAGSGMRGTATDQLDLVLHVDQRDVLTDSFGAILNRTLLPISHLLWVGCWLGIARAALTEARRLLRSSRRQSGARPRLFAEALTQLDRHQAWVLALAKQTDARAGGTPNLRESAELNMLKVATGRASAGIVRSTLEIAGMRGYITGGELRLERHMRDINSALVMVPNYQLEDAVSEVAGLLSPRRL